MKTYSLHELNEFLRRVVALNFNESIWLTAEIGQISESRSHRFLSLLEKEGETVVAELSAVIWASDFRRIKRVLGDNTEGVLSDGAEVRLRGRLDFHERYGLKFVVEDVDPTFTLGKMELERQELIASLEAEGLLRLNAQHKLPVVLQRLAVISSETAAGWEDFRSHIEENDYGYDFDIQFYAAAMQGIFVEKEVMRQLTAIEARKADFDAVIIIRGGGAKLDLAAFDGGALCRAIADFPLPVLTGIGHEVDSTVADLVAHTSLKTPTAVADFLLAHNAQFESQVLELGNALRFYAQNRLNTEGGYLARAESILTFPTQFLLKNQHQKLDELSRRLAASPSQILKFEKIRIDNALKIMDLMSVEATLKRGFSITRHADGSFLTRVKDIKKGDILETELSDGKLQSVVK
jgi:exodeoxyribonuclease VII large subunit